jgi:hypothetical protein
MGWLWGGVDAWIYFPALNERRDRRNPLALFYATILL